MGWWWRSILWFSGFSMKNHRQFISMNKWWADEAIWCSQITLHSLQVIREPPQQQIRILRTVTCIWTTNIYRIIRLHNNCDLMVVGRMQANRLYTNCCCRMVDVDGLVDDDCVLFGSVYLPICFVHGFSNRASKSINPTARLHSCDKSRSKSSNWKTVNAEMLYFEDWRPTSEVSPSSTCSVKGEDIFLWYALCSIAYLLCVINIFIWKWAECNFNFLKYKR